MCAEISFEKLGELLCPVYALHFFLMCSGFLDFMQSLLCECLDCKHSHNSFPPWLNSDILCHFTALIDIASNLQEEKKGGRVTRKRRLSSQKAATTKDSGIVAKSFICPQ